MAKTDFIGGMVVGIGLAYFLDADRGGERRRRAAARLDALVDAVRPHVGQVRPHYGARLGDLAGLEAANLAPGRSGGPSAALVMLLGGALAAYGLSRRGALASAARMLGLGLVAGGSGRTPSGAVERRRVVDIQKSLFIAAPVAAVFGFWDSYESFPLFLPNVREVEDLGGGRARWVIRGPGDRPIGWETVLTHWVPGELIAWRSQPGSMLVTAGAIRFTPDGGGTRVDLRFCYQPPEGGGDPAVTALLGADPRATLNQDLGRLKSVLEAAERSQAHGHEPGP